MKIIIIALASLFIGAGVGWYLGYTRPMAKENRYAYQELRATEADDYMAAIIAVKSIPFVESGDTKHAIDWLVKPVGNYWRVYALNAGTNDERLRMRAEIERLAATNAAVAAEIHRN